MILIKKMSMIFYLFILIIVFTIGRFIRFIYQAIKGLYEIHKFFENLKLIKTILNIKFIDYQDNNYFNEIRIKATGSNSITMNINKNSLYIPIFAFENKTTFEYEISIINSTISDSRTFKITIYKDFINNINIYLNNKTEDFYSSELILYGNVNEANLGDLVCDTFGLTKRKRCLILNIEQKSLIKIIKDNNNYNNQLNLKIPHALLTIDNRNLLINIFIGINKSNVLIFVKEVEKQLISVEEEEKNLISKFYRNIIENINKEKESESKSDIDISEYCQLFIEDNLLKRKTLFGAEIGNEIKNSIYKIIISYINQGVNCLFENNLLNEKDKDFLFGCLILLLYTYEKIDSLDYDIIMKLNKIMKNMEKNNFNICDQFRAVITFVIFYINAQQKYKLKITKNLSKENHYIKAFEFYKDIINALSEESELVLMFLQLNSGSGKEILNDKTCYKISMISINKIKEYLLNNIPRYFYCYKKKNGNDIAISDPRTQVMGFNESEIFIKKSKTPSKEENENEIMNIVICLFHEGGHQKFHMNINMKFKNEPILFMTKRYNLENQEYLNIGGTNNDIKIGESGMSVDYYLYYFSLYPAQILTKSLQSHKLLKKNYFTGDLYVLNTISLKIINN